MKNWGSTRSTTGEEGWCAVHMQLVCCGPPVLGGCGGGSAGLQGRRRKATWSPLFVVYTNLAYRE
jgi:hypothetical protein